MSSDSMESQCSCAALPDPRSTQSSRRPPLPLPLACEERRGASDHCGRRSRAQQHRLRRKRRIFRWGAISSGGPLGLCGDLCQFLVYTQSDLEYDIDPEYTPWCTQFDPGDHNVPGNSCAHQWWNLCDDDLLKSCDCTRAGTPPRLTRLSARHVSVSSRRSSDVLTNTCSRSVAPVNSGPPAMTIFRILDPWTTKRERRCTRTVIPLSGKNALVNSRGHRGALIDMSSAMSRAVSPANGGTRATMKVHSRLERNVRNRVVCALRRRRQLLHLDTNPSSDVCSHTVENHGGGCSARGESDLGMTGRTPAPTRQGDLTRKSAKT